MVESLAYQTVKRLKEKSVIVATAESCTGGLLSATLTHIQGASEIFDRGFITYSNQAKMDMLGVRSETLKTFGAVSAQTAKEMAQGAYTFSQAHLSIAITGVAGPKTSENKPVGLVYIAMYKKNDPIHVQKHTFEGNRESIRKHTVTAALTLLNTHVKQFYT